jgi:hypothetical protein
MTSPKLGAPELVASQAVPETTVNEQLRYAEQGSSHYPVIDKDENDPPGSPAEGDAYIVAATATGAWAGHEDDIAFVVGGAWAFIAPVEGLLAYPQDEGTLYVYNGTAWAALSVPATGNAALSVTTESGTAYTAVLGDAEGYKVFTSGSAVTFTVPPNSSVAFDVGTRLYFEQQGAGAVTVAEGAGVTVNSRADDLELAGQYAAAVLVKVGTDTWTLTGDL